MTGKKNTTSSDTASQPSSNFNPEIEELKEAIIAINKKAKHICHEQGDELRHKANQHPLKTLGITLGVGVIIGLLLRK